MKALGMMHCFLGLELWQYPDEIFLNQGKYAVEILKRFGMKDCKAVTTPMTTNLKLLNGDTSEAVDVTLYKHITGSLMYLTNTRPDIFFCCKYSKSIYGESQTYSPSRSKTCDEVSKGNFRLWAQIYLRQ